MGEEMLALSLQTLDVSSKTCFIFYCIYFKTSSRSITPSQLSILTSIVINLSIYTFDPEAEANMADVTPPAGFSHLQCSLSGKYIHLFEQMSCFPPCTLTLLWQTPGGSRHRETVFHGFLYCVSEIFASTLDTVAGHNVFHFVSSFICDLVWQQHTVESHRFIWICFILKLSWQVFFYSTITVIQTYKIRISFLWLKGKKPPRPRTRMYSKHKPQLYYSILQVWFLLHVLIYINMLICIYMEPCYGLMSSCLTELS